MAEGVSGCAIRSSCPGGGAGEGCHRRRRKGGVKVATSGPSGYKCWLASRRGAERTDKDAGKMMSDVDSGVVAAGHLKGGGDVVG